MANAFSLLKAFECQICGSKTPDVMGKGLIECSYCTQRYELQTDPHFCISLSVEQRGWIRCQLVSLSASPSPSPEPDEGE